MSTPGMEKEKRERKNNNKQPNESIGSFKAPFFASCLPVQAAVFIPQTRHINIADNVSGGTV